MVVILAHQRQTFIPQEQRAAEVAEDLNYYFCVIYDELVLSVNWSKNSLQNSI